MDTIPCRPKRTGATPYTFFNFHVRSAAIDLTGVGPPALAVFPLATRVAVLDWAGMLVGIIGMSLSTSLLNQTPLDTVAVIAALDVGDQLAANGANGIFLTHLVRQNATGAQRFASSRSNAIEMGQDSAYKLDSNQRIALYVASAAVAGNEISAMLSVYWTPFQQ